MALLSGRTDAQKHVDAKPEPPVTPPVPVAPVTLEPATPEGIAKAVIDTEAAKAKAEAEVAEKAELDFIGGMVTLAPELAANAAPVRARSDKQHKMDEQVAKLHAAWVKADRPAVTMSTWTKAVAAKVVGTYFAEPDKSAGLKLLIDRAVRFHDYRVVYGTSFTATEKLVRQYQLPEAYIGREVISFAVLDKRPRATSGGRSASAIVETNSSK